MYNKVVLAGNLARDIEVRYTQGGSAIGKTAIATNRRYKSQTGEQKEEVMFIDLTFFSLDKNMGQAYVVPYKGVAQFQIGYLGYLTLARRSGEIKKLSPGARKTDSIWELHTEAMWKKTVIKRSAKYLPLSVEAQRASRIDELQDAGVYKVFPTRGSATGLGLPLGTPMPLISHGKEHVWQNLI
jgi:hypothetical protein